MGRSVSVLVIVVAVLLGGSVALGAIPGAGGKIDGCFTKIGGFVRVIDKAKGESCGSKLEVPLSWNQAGPAGPAGADGAGGEKGDAGPAGPAGTTGQAGGTVFGASGIVVFEPGTLVPVNGLSKIVEQPASSVLYISTDGGMSNLEDNPSAEGIVEISLRVDGVAIRQERVHVEKAGGVGAWSMSTTRTLPPGPHEVDVAASLIGTGEVGVSGSPGGFRNSQLTVLTLKT